MSLLSQLWPVVFLRSQSLGWLFTTPGLEGTPLITASRGLTNACLHTHFSVMQRQSARPVAPGPRHPNVDVREDVKATAALQMYFTEHNHPFKLKESAKIYVLALTCHNFKLLKSWGLEFSIYVSNSRLIKLRIKLKHLPFSSENFKNHTLKSMSVSIILHN